MNSRKLRRMDRVRWRRWRGSGVEGEGGRSWGIFCEDRVRRGAEICFGKREGGGLAFGGNGKWGGGRGGGGWGVGGGGYVVVVAEGSVFAGGWGWWGDEVAELGREVGQVV